MEKTSLTNKFSAAQLIETSQQTLSCFSSVTQPCWRCRSWSCSFKIFLQPPLIPVTTLFKISSSTSFIIFASASNLGSSKIVLILLHSKFVLRGPSARSETTLSRPRGIQRRPADTTNFNHSRLNNALRAAYTTFHNTRCGCPDAVPLDLRRRQTGE